MKKKLLIVISSVIVVAAAVLATLFFTGVISFSGLKTVTYTDNAGGQWRVAFYPQYHTSTAGSPPVLHLVADKRKDGKLPIEMSIIKSNNASDPSVCTALDLSANNLKILSAFNVRNNNLSQDITVCSVQFISGQFAGLTYSYIAGFSYNGAVYSITFTGDISNASAAEDKNLSSVTDLTPYMNDMKQILASIKPL